MLKQSFGVQLFCVNAAEGWIFLVESWDQVEEEPNEQVG
jgi:hypothetical protein